MWAAIKSSLQNKLKSKIEKWKKLEITKLLKILVIIFSTIIIMIFLHRWVHNYIQRSYFHDREYLEAMYAKLNYVKIPKIYAITPTYARPEQKAELTRLSHIFLLVPNLHWIIVEDSRFNTRLVTKLLKRTGLTCRSTQLNVRTPLEYLRNIREDHSGKPRGVGQRNLGLQWIRDNVDATKRSIVYFMDDDNTYSVELFDQMLMIEKGRVGIWPVGFVGGLMVETPILNDAKTEVISFNAVWHPERPFPIDMAAFAISSDLIFKFPKVEFSYKLKKGLQESEILRQLITIKDLQPLANQCRDVLVWHTRTSKPRLHNEIDLNKEGKQSNAGIEV